MARKKDKKAQKDKKAARDKQTQSAHSGAPESPAAAPLSASPRPKKK